MFSTIFCCLSVSRIPVGLVSMILLTVHQLLLTGYGLTDFIQNDNRDGIVAANKEGIISLLGYLSLHLMFVEIGKFVLKIRQVNNYSRCCVCKVLAESNNSCFCFQGVHWHNG